MVNVLNLHYQYACKQILKILRGKDETIQALQLELEESTRALQQQADAARIEQQQQREREGKSTDYLTGRALSLSNGVAAPVPVPDPATVPTPAQVAPGTIAAVHGCPSVAGTIAASAASDTEGAQRDLMLSQVQQQLQHLEQELSAEKQAHLQSRTELNTAYDTISDLRRSLQQYQQSRVPEQQHHLRELQGLRDRNADMRQQIEVLVTELAQLRGQGQGQGGRSSSSGKEAEAKLLGEVHALRKELSRLQKRLFNAYTKH